MNEVHFESKIRDELGFDIITAKCLIKNISTT